jgi:hypothetical protein
VATGFGVAVVDATEYGGVGVATGVAASDEGEL